jgi:putative PIN family toxin of toxin-antitoxin system
LWHFGLVTVVLDTNVLVSACWTPGGLEERVLRMVLDGRLQIAVTAPVWEEYRDVLSRPKLASIHEKAAALLSRLESMAIRVASGPRLSAAGDEDDNRFLECAVAAGATFLITGNLKHYPAGWTRPRIVNARQFLTERSGGATV